MSFIVIGTNHRRSPVYIREKIAFRQKALGHALHYLKEYIGIQKAVILSTCNRIEIYAHTESADAGVKRLKQFVSFYHQVSIPYIEDYLYVYTEKEALQHLVSVASGVDSMIVGETQILGQVRNAFFEAQANKCIDQFLHKLFSFSLETAQKVHRATRLTEGKVSVGSVAVDFIKETLGTLADKHVLIIGVGKVTELVAKYLHKEKPRVVFVSNRSFDKAQMLAGSIEGKAVRFNELKDIIERADVIITATASPHFIIKKDTLAESKKNVLIIDLSVPRNVDPLIKELNFVELYYLDELQGVISKNIEKRKQESHKASAIIRTEVDKEWERCIGLEQEKVLSQ